MTSVLPVVLQLLLESSPVNCDGELKAQLGRKGNEKILTCDMDVSVAADDW